MAARHGVEVLDYAKGISDELREMTGGRRPDAVVDAVGMEAHGSPVAGFAHQALGLLPDKVAQKAMESAGVDRLAVVQCNVRRWTDELYEKFQKKEDGCIKVVLKP